MIATRRALLGSLAAAPLMPAFAGAQAAPIRLFRVVTTRGEVTLGFTQADLAGLGEGDAVERIARALARDGQVSGWHYTVTRAADGSTHFATRDKVAVMRQDGVMVEAYTPALPVLPPPRG